MAGGQLPAEEGHQSSGDRFPWRAQGGQPLRVVPAAPVGDAPWPRTWTRPFAPRPASPATLSLVSARGGNVELKGTVETATARLDAEYAAWHVPGVSQVTNKLHVGAGRIMGERELSGAWRRPSTGAWRWSPGASVSRSTRGLPTFPAACPPAILPRGEDLVRLAPPRSREL